MADYILTLTDEQDAALGIVVSRANPSTLDPNGKLTTEGYLQRRVSELVDGYVGQVLSEETQSIAEAYKSADDAKRAEVKDALGVVDAGVAVDAGV